jgi:hypothetical protein
MTFEARLARLTRSRPAGTLCLFLAVTAITLAAWPTTARAGAVVAISAVFLGSLCWSLANARAAIVLAAFAAVVALHFMNHPVDVQELHVVTTTTAGQS